MFAFMNHSSRLRYRFKLERNTKSFVWQPDFFFYFTSHSIHFSPLVKKTTDRPTQIHSILGAILYTLNYQESVCRLQNHRIASSLLTCSLVHLERATQEWIELNKNRKCWTIVKKKHKIQNKKQQQNYCFINDCVLFVCRGNVR